MSAGQSVVIVGRTTLEALESSYARAFASLGWEVHRWNPNVAMDRVSRGGKLGRQFARFVHVDAWERKSNLDLLRLVDALRPAVLLVIDTGGIRAGTLGQIRARCPATRLFCMYPDSPHNLDSARIAALPLFDRVATSSPAWVDVFRRLGALRCEYLPFAADTLLHKPSPGPHVMRGDVCFVGTWRPEREAFLEAFADLDLQIWGSSYWRTRTRRGSPLRARWQGRTLDGTELGAVSATTRVMLNVMDPVTWPGPNMRTFEQAACGAFSLTTRSPAVLGIFTEGENIECFDNVDEARLKVDQYIADERTRARVAREGYELMTRAHTYDHRVVQLLSWIEEGAPDGAPAQAGERR